MSKESIGAWEICRGVTAEAFETLIISKEDKTIQKVCRYLVLSLTDLVNQLSQFASRTLIIEVLGTFVERLKIEEEIQEKFGPPPSRQELFELALGRDHTPSDDEGGPEGNPPESNRTM